MIGYGMMWVAISFAVSVGIYYTHDANCLWALIFGIFVSYSSSKNKNDN